MKYLCYLNLVKVKNSRFIIDLSIICKTTRIHFFFFSFLNVSPFAASVRMCLQMELCPKGLWNVVNGHIFRAVFLQSEDLNWCPYYFYIFMQHYVFSSTCIKWTRWIDGGGSRACGKEGIWQAKISCDVNYSNTSPLNNSNVDQSHLFSTQLRTYK